DADDSRRRLGDKVEARPISPRTCLPEARDAGVNDPRIDGAHGLVVDAEPLHGAEPIVLDNHVRGLSETEERAAPGIAFKVENDRALAAVHVQKAEAVVALELEPHGPARLVAIG